jgi:hypothetical protein
MNYRICDRVALASVGIALVWASLGTASEIAPANLDFEQGQPGQAPPHWVVPKVSGYQVLVSDENPKSGKQCVMIERTAEKPGPFGNVIQGIDATSFRGKRVRYRAAVRTEIDGQKGRAQLWLRVDLSRKKGQQNIGFFDNMAKRPINKNNWEYYEIVGDVAEDAETICLGMFLAGSGRAWIDDVSLEVVDKDTKVTGRALGTMGGMSFDNIGPGLLEIDGAMQLTHQPSLVSQVAATLGIAAGAPGDEQDKTVSVLLPLPLAYRQQVPVTYELTVDPPEASSSVTVYQDTPHNHVAKVSVVLNSKRNKVDVKFRSLVLVGPSPFSNVPDRAELPDQWPEECQPWLKSTWCVDWQNEKIQALSKEIRGNSNDVMTIIAVTQERAGTIFFNAQGQAWDLTSVEALTGRGSCTSCANLVAALLRGNNIPARVVAGYPSWTGPLQTHYMVEAYVPEFGWYPIESTMCKAPWANEYQINVAIIPPEYESKELAGVRTQIAAGVPYLSLTEMPDCPSGVICEGTIEPGRSCDHQCKMVRRFSISDSQWDSALAGAASRWRKWLASKAKQADARQLVLGPKAEAVEATSASELIKELTQ